MILEPSVLTKIKKNKVLRRSLMKQNNINETTLLRWLRENYTDLVLIGNLILIANHLKTDVNSLYIKTEADFVDVE